MTQTNLKKAYRDLEARVFAELRDRINKSKTESEHISDKAIKVNVFDYTELVIVNDRLTFIDSDGYHYNVYAECALEDLIDILSCSE